MANKEKYLNIGIIRERRKVETDTVCPGRLVHFYIASVICKWTIILEHKVRNGGLSLLSLGCMLHNIKIYQIFIYISVICLWTGE